MGLPFLSARSQALPGELAVPEWDVPGALRTRALARLPASRGEAGKPRKTRGPHGTRGPRHCGVLGPSFWGARDFAAGGAAAFEPKLRPPAAVTLAAAPARLLGSPDFPRRRSPGTRQDRGTLGTRTRPSPAPRGLPPPCPYSPCPERTERGAAGGWAERVPSAPFVPGGSGAGRGRVRAGRGTPWPPRPAPPPLGTRPEPRHTADGEPTRAEDEPPPQRISDLRFGKAGILCPCLSRGSLDPIRGLHLTSSLLQRVVGTIRKKEPLGRKVSSQSRLGEGSRGWQVLPSHSEQETK